MSTAQDTRRAALLAYYVKAHADVLLGAGDNANAPGILDTYAERIARDMTRHGIGGNTYDVTPREARAALAARLGVFTCDVCGGACGSAEAFVLRMSQALARRRNGRA